MPRTSSSLQLTPEPWDRLLLASADQGLTAYSQAPGPLEKAVVLMEY
jgi:hypothetical protein